MSNFFAALDDSDNEGNHHAPAPAAIATKKTKAATRPAPKPEVVEPSKVVDRRPNGDQRRGGRGGGRAPTRDGKRTHDRRSGTGRGKEIKKNGGGGRNWGSDRNDAKKAEGAVTEGMEDDALAAAREEEGSEPVAKEEEIVEETTPEPEDTTLSYDEYLAQKARPDSEAFKPLEERAVENEFAGKAATKKETEDFLVMGGGKQPKKKGSGKKEKETLVLDFKVKSAIGDDRGDRGGAGGRREGGRRSDGGRNGGDRRENGRREGRGGRDGRGGGGDRGGRRDRGGRGGGRGGGGGGRGGGGRGVVDTTDDSAFPSL